METDEQNQFRIEGTRELDRAVHNLVWLFDKSYKGYPATNLSDALIALSKLPDPKDGDYECGYVLTVDEGEFTLALMDHDEITHSLFSAAFQDMPILICKHILDRGFKEDWVWKAKKGEYDAVLKRRQIDSGGWTE